MATIIVDDSEADSDWPALVNSLGSEKLKLTQSLNAMMAEKDSIAMSLEGNHEDKIDRIVKLEDRIAELLNTAQQHKEECTTEIAGLKEKLKKANLTAADSNDVPSELQNKEDAYRQTIAEADSLLSKMEADYQTTIKVCKVITPKTWYDLSTPI